MKTVRKPPRLVCLKCEGETFALAEGEIVQNFRGETLRVHTPVMRCVACGWETLGPGQVDALRLATAEAYRDRHGLLTASQIRAIREAAGLSQRAFAAALDVGEASIPRWESWQVQESAYDERIRRFASRAALRPLPTVRVLAGHVRMSATPITPWQQLVWSAMAQGLQTKGGPAPLPGLAAYEPRTIVQRTVRLPLNDDAGSSAEIEDDSFCAHA